MCGRYALNVQAKILEEQFRAICRVELGPRYNVAPSQPVAIVRDMPTEREINLVRWGLVPSWAKDIKVGYRMINARSETAATNGAFKHALKRRRCLVPVSGFYFLARTARVATPPFPRRSGPASRTRSSSAPTAPTAGKRPRQTG